MADTTQSEQLDDPEAGAEATVTTTPEGPSARFKLPQKFAGDMLPMLAIAACIVVPATALIVAGAVLPWWAVLVTALAGPVLATAIFVLSRLWPAQPVAEPTE